jgi:hypothetical protein
MSDQYVVIREMSAGNESVGEMWKETKVFDGNATLEEVMLWANDVAVTRNMASRKNIILTKAAP